ncbi:hypothetical protein STEG23_016094 [Scotinomys teguina]
MEVVTAPRCQLLLIVLMAAMLLPGMKVSPLLVQRTVTRTVGKDFELTLKSNQSDIQFSHIRSETYKLCSIFLKEMV